jgi:hypothetical protein
LIEKPRSPFRCDVCGATIPDHEAGTFTTLPKMYYDTPPAGYEPCNRAESFDAFSAEYEVVAPAGSQMDPQHGGRFVLTREGDAMPPVYGVEVFLPGGVRLASVLRWDGAARPVLDPPLSDTWAHDETLKLARVLSKDPKPRLTRWRSRDA